MFEKFLEKEKLFINLTKTDKFFIKKHKEIVSEKNDIFIVQDEITEEMMEMDDEISKEHK